MELFGFRITLGRVLVAAIIVAIAMVVPAIRNFLWLILPLGSGNDDIIEGIALVAIFMILFVEIWTKMSPLASNQKK